MIVLPTTGACNSLHAEKWLSLKGISISRSVSLNLWSRNFSPGQSYVPIYVVGRYLPRLWYKPKRRSLPPPTGGAIGCISSTNTLYILSFVRVHHCRNADNNLPATLGQLIYSIDNFP